MTDLGTLAGGGSSFANAINGGGQVAGFAITSTNGRHAFLYGGGAMADLGVLPGFDGSDAMGINSSGQIVGWNYITATDVDHAFLDSGGAMVDLNTLIRPTSGWTLWYASAVNDAGQIVGWGSNNGSGTHGFLLTPALPGDATLDGKVDVNDLTIVLTNFNRTGLTNGWTSGDFNGDGQVDVNDLAALFSNWGVASSGTRISTVAEPSGPCAVGHRCNGAAGSFVAA